MFDQPTRDGVARWAFGRFGLKAAVCGGLAIGTWGGTRAVRSLAARLVAGADVSAFYADYQRHRL